MANKIFQTIVNRKIENFILSFIEDAASIYYNDNEGRIFHPGEYGMYRERTLKTLLELFVPKDLKIGDGFIITSNDKRSTQCDIVIYDASDLPFLTNGISQYFPIESVLAIGEVKSVLTKSQLKEALIKLARNKQLQEHRGELIKKCSDNRRLEHDQTITFLVCSKLKGEISELDFDEIYEGIDRKYWHNCILFVEQGLVFYLATVKDMPSILSSNISDPKGLINRESSFFCEYPFLTSFLSTSESYFPQPFYRGISPTKNTLHITHFLDIIIKTLTDRTYYAPDFLDYSDLPTFN